MAWIGLSGPDFEYFSIDIFNELYKSGNSKRSYSSFSEVTQEVFSTKSKMAALCKNITGHSTYRISIYMVLQCNIQVREYIFNEIFVPDEWKEIWLVPKMEKRVGFVSQRLSCQLTISLHTTTRQQPTHISTILKECNISQ